MLILTESDKDFIIKEYPIKGLKYCSEKLNIPSYKIRIYCSMNKIYRNKIVFNADLKKRLTIFNKENGKRLSIIRIGKDLNNYYNIIKKNYFEDHLTQQQIAESLEINKHTLQRFMIKRNLTKKVWCNEEQTILRNIYPSYEKKMILNILKNKTWGQIQRKTNRLKIKRNSIFQFEGIIKNNKENNPMKNPETKRKVRDSLKKLYKKNPKKLLNYKLRRNKKTKIEEIMYDLLVELDFKDNKDFYFNNYFKTKKSYRFPDFIFPSFNTILECDGLYWHSDPNKDKIRDNEFNNRGYNVYHFTDKQILKNIEGVKLEVMKLLKK